MTSSGGGRGGGGRGGSRGSILLLISLVSLCAPQASTAEGAVEGAAAADTTQPPRCPNLCSRQGVCTHGVCRCFKGFMGASCWARDDATPTVSPLPALGGAPASPQRILVMTAQTIQTDVGDDLDVVMPGAAAAKLLAGEGHEVQVVFFLHKEDDKEHTDKWAEELRPYGIQLNVQFKTRHYYLPAHLAHSTEAFAWLCDRKLHGLPNFDAIFFHDSHGLGYFTALAKHQDLEAAGLSGTAIVVRMELPHLWLIGPGGGSGISCVDDLEVNFIVRGKY